MEDPFLLGQSDVGVSIIAYTSFGEKTFLSDLITVFKYWITLLKDWGWVIISDRIFFTVLVLLPPLQAKPEGITALGLHGPAGKREKSVRTGTKSTGPDSLCSRAYGGQPTLRLSKPKSLTHKSWLRNKAELNVALSLSACCWKWLGKASDNMKENDRNSSFQ